MGRPMSLKELLSRATTAALGSFGERLYRYQMEANGHLLETAHFDAFDFRVDGSRRIDVKTTLGKTPRRVSGTNRVRGIEYAYVTIDVSAPSDPIRIHDDSLALIGEVSIHDATSVVNMTSISRRAQNDRKKYWRLQFPPSVKVVYRSSASTTQTRMARQGWGPQAFYDKSDRYCLVVLIYEDDGVFHHAEAYPTSLREEIRFYPVTHIIKSKSNHIMTYDPTALNEKFLFYDASTLTEDIQNRFKLDLERKVQHKR